MNSTRTPHRGARRWATALVMAAGAAGAVEELKFETLRADREFEVRRYPSHVLVEVEVKGDLESAGHTAFRPLYRFITGHNEQRAKIQMTAPVLQAPQSEGLWRVAFVMPAEGARERWPAPADERLRLRVEPGGRYAAVRYSGTWSRERFESHLRKLEQWITTNGWSAAGSPIWARYDPPFMPWFLRRNEILIPLAETE